ncbi:UDP-N-acetylmuramoyl-tripeptide--D-alanyl-D-alanine ligase [Oceanobacillus sojae]|uniref:UDP-N-acetylmuramoyl-tripeptide--D-alanyl-D- alanine ligase n=1 Tax=Oceanobacillus sojae TaxID=582851 RepID=UPI0021A4E446|nr:UDP-N-acetylmuramoyl-tripeptide--D-alanyl-D-alanine ligase [Oceanobacillus sojae]MCT1904229.1 UDP-N-acetylmuramoyl-tripeptide--D-alanyl-D-alanine ligase [Oceanobacillus sojae]
MLFTASQLMELFPRHQGDVPAGLEIHEVIKDSRADSHNGLYVPISGERFDGHQFIEGAVENGAVATFWQRETPLPPNLPSSLLVLFVEDTVKALQELAAVYRKKINPTVIGITGSNGKTTTKDLTKAVLQTTFQTHATKGNFNNHIGLPLTILSMDQKTEVLILEMGMNHFGEIELLSNIGEPDIAIITNIDGQHIENLGSKEGIAKAKLEIVSGIKPEGMLIIDGDEPLLTDAVVPVRKTRVGLGKDNDVIVSNIAVEEMITTFEVGKESYQIPLLGRHHAKNAAYVIKLAYELGIASEAIQKAFGQLEMTKMRFEKHKGKKGITVINDAYNASPASMKASIQVVEEMKGYHHKILVLGDILELGDYAEEFHRGVADVINSEITAVYTYGNNSYYIHDELKKKLPELPAVHLADKDELAGHVEKYLQPENLILLKASRGMKFETFLEQLC